MKNILVIVMCGMFAAGCSNLSKDVKETADRVPLDLLSSQKSGDVNGSAASIKQKGAAYLNPVFVKRTKQPWIGGRLVPVQRQKLPLLFEEKFSLNFGNNGHVSLPVIAARLTKITNVPVRINADALPQSDSSNVEKDSSINPRAVSARNPITANAVDMNWEGTLRGFLDHLASVLNLSWEYRDGGVVMMRLVTQTHQLAIIPAVQKYSFSAGGTGGTNGGSAASLSTQDNFSEEGEISPFASILDAVFEMIKPVEGSTLVPNPGSGLIVVTTSGEVQAKIRDYIALENKRLKQQINVVMDIYTLRDSESANQALNWNLIFETLKTGLSGSIPNSILPTDTANLSTRRITGKFADSSLILNALHKTGLNVSHRPISLTTSNGRLKSQYNSNTQAYVSETTPGVASSSGAAGAPGLKTDTIVTGDAFSVLPIVQPDNSILVRYSIILSSLVRLDNFTSGSGSTIQTVQIPATETITDGANVQLQAGQAVLITGLSRLVSSTDKTRLGEDLPLLLGGSNADSLVREYFLVVVRATPL